MLDPPDQREPPARPSLPPGIQERVRAWLTWVGPGRVAAGSVTVLAVLAAAYWLVRPPAPSTESRLPFSSTTSGAVAPSGSGDDAPTRSQVGTQAPPSDDTTAATLVVHVAGAVTAGGVYRLPPGARVIDAVTIAGGLTIDAQPDAVNLAAPLTDGQRVYVPRVGEQVAVVDVGTPTTVAASGPVDINRAGVDELDALPGVGPATAAAIVAHRDRNGPFSSIDELADVRGIGPAKLEALRGLVTV